jgi:hypothetical protein
VPQGRHPTCQEAAALGGRRPSGVNVAAASRLDHPGTVYLREVDLLPHLDGWRIGLFHPAVLDATLDALIAASQDASGTAEACARSSGRWPTATATARLPRYRAALDAEAMISAVSVQLTARQESIYNN